MQVPGPFQSALQGLAVVPDKWQGQSQSALLPDGVVAPGAASDVPMTSIAAQPLQGGSAFMLSCPVGPICNSWQRQECSRPGIKHRSTGAACLCRSEQRA